MKKLDKYDSKILYELDIDGRAPASQIAKKIRLAKETVNYKIKRLRKEGYISHFNTLVNASRLGYTYFKILLKFHKITSKAEEDIVEFLLKEKSCANIRVTEGPFDISFLAIHMNYDELKYFIQRFYEKFGRYVFQKSIHVITTSHKLNQKFLYQGESVRKSIQHGDLQDHKIDMIDLKILKGLTKNGRGKIVDIAKLTRCNPRIVRYRIKELEKKGIISGYYPSLNLDIFKREFVQFDISVKDLKKINTMIEFFDNTNTCLFAYEVVGFYDLSIELYVKNDDELRDIVNRFKEIFVEDYVFYDVSRIYKEYMTDWSPFEAYHPVDEEKVMR